MINDLPVLEMNNNKLLLNLDYTLLTYIFHLDTRSINVYINDKNYPIIIDVDNINNDYYINILRDNISRANTNHTIVVNNNSNIYVYGFALYTINFEGNYNWWDYTINTPLVKDITMKLNELNKLK
jgi:hypothetical protein